jgi:hypothetical protein
MHEMPEVSAEHHKLHRLAGTWGGEPSAAAPG